MFTQHQTFSWLIKTKTINIGCIDVCLCIHMYIYTRTSFIQISICMYRTLISEISAGPFRGLPVRIRRLISGIFRTHAFSLDLAFWITKVRVYTVFELIGTFSFFIFLVSILSVYIIIIIWTMNMWRQKDPFANPFCIAKLDSHTISKICYTLNFTISNQCWK